MPRFMQRMLFSKFLEDGETLYYAIHRHWVMVYKQMMKIGIFGILIPLFFLIFMTGTSSEAAYFFFAWLGIGLFYTVFAFLDWYMDAWLLTDVSIIELQWDGFFSQRSSRLDYYSIETINYDVQGVIQSMLGCGKLTLIKYSGTPLVIEQVDEPEVASHWITRIKNENQASRSTQSTESMKDLLAEVISDRININS